MRAVRVAFLVGLVLGGLILRTFDVIRGAGCDTSALEQRVYAVEQRLDGHEEDDAVQVYYDLNGIR